MFFSLRYYCLLIFSLLFGDVGEGGGSPSTTLVEIYGITHKQVSERARDGGLRERMKERALNLNSIRFF